MALRREWSGVSLLSILGLTMGFGQIDPHRTKRSSLFAVAAVSLVFNYLFFAEYLSPLRRVHIPYDLEGYHYPLVDYAFQALKAGHFPEWDWTIYCGQSFVGNIQATLFYPPTWLLFAANFVRAHVSYQSLQVFQLAHVWLAFLLCYVWLRGRRLEELACLLGASVFAYSGYMLLQLQHQGLIGGYTWFPLGFLGIDQAAESKTWRPFWKLMAASALCFLAGYPPTWVVFAISMLTYAAFARSPGIAIPGAVASLAASFGLAMIQLLPTLEATSLKMPELRYGIGIKSWAFYLSYLVPNFYNFGLKVDVHTNPGKEYLYLGAPAFLGVLCLIRRRSFRVVVPALASGLVCIIFLTNPYGLVWSVIQHSALLVQIVRDWYFLAGVHAALAGLAAYGLDDFLRRETGLVRHGYGWAAMALLTGWSLWSLIRWLPSGPGFSYGLPSIADPVIFLILFAGGVYLVRAEQGSARLLLIATLLLAVGVDYKVFGTSKRFNASEDSGPRFHAPNFFPQIDDTAYAQIRAHRESRILFDFGGPLPLSLRHYPGLRTPQGFDPLFATQYYDLIAGDAHFQNSWEFDINPDKSDLLRLLSVRYFISTEYSPHLAVYRDNSAFGRIATDTTFYRVFEYRDAQPSFGWDSEGDSTAKISRWMPELREFIVHSTTGGRFTFHEQLWPGWQAFIDGKDVPLERWHGAFQAVRVPAGDHRILFRFRSPGMRLGAWISLVSLVSLLALLLPGIKLSFTTKWVTRE
jgi:hypothetical protein